MKTKIEIEGKIATCVIEECDDRYRISVEFKKPLIEISEEAARNLARRIVDGEIFGAAATLPEKVVASIASARVRNASIAQVLTETASELMTNISDGARVMKNFLSAEELENNKKH